MFRKRYLRPALDAGLIAMPLPDKPNSCLQQVGWITLHRSTVRHYGG
ncbi:Fic family protein [Pseudomonas sp. Ga0074129]